MANKDGKGGFQSGNKAAQGRKLAEKELWAQVVTEDDKKVIIQSVVNRLLRVEDWTKSELALLQWMWERMHGRPLEQVDNEKRFILELTGNAAAIQDVKDKLEPDGKDS